jgi:hypothetical protein
MMKVELKLDKNNNGGFYIMDEAEQIAEMAISAMVDHARKNGLKVIALCPFVHAQFKRHPEQYADIWNKGSE